MSFDEHRIKILSYQSFFMSVAGRNRNVGLPASNGAPSVEYFSFDDLEYLNSQSPALRNGLIEFEDDVRDEVYKRLNIDPENCFYERDIDNMLLHPTVEGMKKIVAISDSLTIERIRGHMAKLYSSLTQNVIKVVEQRAREIANGVRKTNIEIEPIAAKPDVANNEQIQQMTSQIDAQNNQIAELKAMLQALLANQQPAVVNEPVVETPAKVEKKPGRPAKK